MAQRSRGSSRKRTTAHRSNALSLLEGRIQESDGVAVPSREQERQLLQTIGSLLQQREAANDAARLETR